MDYLELETYGALLFDISDSYSYWTKLTGFKKVVV